MSSWKRGTGNGEKKFLYNNIINVIIFTFSFPGTHWGRDFLQVKNAEYLTCKELVGVDDGIRTRDPESHSLMLYPTELRPPHCIYKNIHIFHLARQEGLEPSTAGLEIRCSIQLSYWRLNFVENYINIRMNINTILDYLHSDRDKRCNRLNGLPERGISYIFPVFIIHPLLRRSNIINNGKTVNALF